MKEEDIINLLSEWRKRLNSNNTLDYKTALSECIFELQSLLNPPIEEDDYWDEIFQSLPPITVIDNEQ